MNDERRMDDGRLFHSTKSGVAGWALGGAGRQFDCKLQTAPVPRKISFSRDMHDTTPSRELTPGQMARMIVQVKEEKDYIYCNYANVLDETKSKCGTSPTCGSTTTSPKTALEG